MSGEFILTKVCVGAGGGGVVVAGAHIDWKGRVEVI